MYIVNIINKLNALRYADNCNFKISMKIEKNELIALVEWD